MAKRYAECKNWLQDKWICDDLGLIVLLKWKKKGYKNVTQW